MGAIVAYDQRSLDDYVDVATRIADFRAKHPDGYLAPADPAQPYRIEKLDAGLDARTSMTVHQTFIVYVAAAYREPGDEHPGIGMAWEVFPGRTPYTRGSELMNAETSAWGRAIIALGASDSKLGIASREEVRNRQAERDQPASVGLDAAEREAAGMMTTGQRREHGKLAGMDKPPRPADRANDPVDDVWTGQPAGEWQPVEGETAPGSSNNKQWQRLGILYGQIGVTDRDDRLADMRNRTGRDLASAKDLSYVEAQAAIAALEPIAKETAK